VWAAFKLMYEHLDKTTIVVLDFFFPNLKWKMMEITHISWK
jgi:hypothetical protein